MKIAIIFIVSACLVVGGSADCFDMTKNGYETDIDCGGHRCWARCSIGSNCKWDSDCESGSCNNNVCVLAGSSNALKDTEARVGGGDCFDFKKNGQETDTDCGGPDCWTRCSAGSSCLTDKDCTSGYCESLRCAVAPRDKGDCFDLNVNGEETDVDCGGPNCWARCAVGSKCISDMDCESGSCILNVCESSEFARFLSGSGASGASSSGASSPELTCDANKYIKANACADCSETQKTPQDNKLTSCNTIQCPENQYIVNRVCTVCPPGTETTANNSATACEPITCSQNQYIDNRECKECAKITKSNGGNSTGCEPVTCTVDQYVSNHGCVQCEDGTEVTQTSHSRISCSPILCDANERVVNHACDSCPPGTRSDPNADASGGDTICTDIVCNASQYVLNHKCKACAPGKTSSPANATANDTSCVATTCPTDYYVSNHKCTMCPLGKINVNGDDASGNNTVCDGLKCAVNQKVVNHACVNCAPGKSNDAGNEPHLGNTTCTEVICNKNFHVVSNKCEQCAPGKTNPAGNKATGANTQCTKILCGVDEFVSNNVCSQCPAGTDNVAGGHDASGEDTECNAIVCGKNEKVVSNVCESCPAGKTSETDDLANGGDTTCNAIKCGKDEKVESNACVKCPAGRTNAPFDDASKNDTKCNEVAEAKVVLTSSIVISGIHASDIDEDEKLKLAKTIAGALGVDAKRVRIDGVVDGKSSASRRLASHGGSTGVVVKYSVIAIETGEELDGLVIDEVKERMKTIATGTKASAILDTIAADLNVDRKVLSITSGEIEEIEAPLCAKNEKVESHVCVACEDGFENDAGDDAAGTDTTCTLSLGGSALNSTSVVDKSDRNMASVFMVLFGIAFVLGVVYEIWKHYCGPKKEKDINTVEMTKV